MNDIYYVYGGVFNDMTFIRVSEDTYEEHGPFFSYQAAYDCWKANMWKNVDNALHRLMIDGYNTVGGFKRHETLPKRN